jgi:hypothetical protein
VTACVQKSSQKQGTETACCPGVERYRALAWRALLPALATLALAGCSTARLTEPAQTATEQLLVTTAVDHAVGALKPPITPGSKVFVDAQFFDSDGAIVLPKYTIGAVRDLVLRSGSDLVDDRKAADQIVELRDGTQSIDHHGFLIGLPSIPIPIPAVGSMTTPEIALFKRDRQKGVSKIALTVYDAKSGALAGSTGAVYGTSQDTSWTVLLLISWDTDDISPPEEPKPASSP